jgi:hypothetical protein
MKSLRIDESYKIEILKMHGFIKEQASGLGPDDVAPGDPASPYNADGTTKTTTPTISTVETTKTDSKVETNTLTKTDADVLNNFIKVVESKCLGGKRSEIRKLKDGIYFVSRKSRQGLTYYFTSDMNILNQQGKVYDKFYCPEANVSTVSSQNTGQTNQAGQTAGKPSLDNSQKDIIKQLRTENWFEMAQPPSEYQLRDGGEYEKLDLTGKDAENNGKISGDYSQYYPYFEKLKDKFYVYRKIQKVADAKQGTKLEVNSQNCKTAIETLWNNQELGSRTYPLGDAERANLKSVVRICKERANKGMFNFRFELKKKLKDLKV